MFYNKTKQKSGNLFIYYFPILFILCYSYIILQMPHVFEDIYIYSGYGKYSDPLKFFTLCYIAAIC